MIAPSAVRLPSLKSELGHGDNRVVGQVETRLNFGTHCQVCLRCGTERLWLAAQNDLVKHLGVERGCEITVDLRSDGLLCWPHPDGFGY